MTTTELRTTAASIGTPSTSNRRPDIQGLRAIAVLLVVAFHAGLPLPGGFVGVDVFFVISGFVITAMLTREWSATGRLRFRTFYFRRFLRLTPALALMVTLVAAASILLQNPFGAQQTTARTGLGAMFLSANFAIAHATGDYFAESATTNPLLHTWSLSVEEQFYLAFPALLLVGWTLARRSGRRIPVVALVFAVAAVSFVLSVATSFGWGSSAVTEFLGGPTAFAFYSPFTRAWEFAVGALLALLINRLVLRNVAAIRGAAWLGAIILAASALLIHDSMPFPGLVVLAPVLGTALLLLAGSSAQTEVTNTLATRPMVSIGDLSYSWYLWHWPIIVFTALLFPNSGTALVVAAVLSLVPAVLSYRVLEQPLRRMRPRTRIRATAVVATTLAIPIAMATFLLVGANSGWGLVPTAPVTTPVVDQPAVGAQPGAPVVTNPTTAASTPTEQDPAAQEQATEDGEVAGGDGGSLRSQHIAVRGGCVNTDLDPVKCRFGPAAPARTVLLVGDSQAYALADGVAAAAEQLGLGTVVTSHTGCPFLDRESSGVHNYPCRSWQQSIIDYALAEPPAAVVIANRSAGYVHPEWNWRTAQTDSGGRAGSVSEAVDAWRAGLEPVIRTVSLSLSLSLFLSYQHQVLSVQSSPSPTCRE